MKNNQLKKQILATFLAFIFIMPNIFVVPFITGATDNILYSQDFESTTVGELPPEYSALTITNGHVSNQFAVTDAVANSVGGTNKSLKHFIQNTGKQTARITADIGNTYTSGKIAFQTKVYTVGDGYSKALYLLNNAAPSNMAANNHVVFGVVFANGTDGNAGVKFQVINDASGAVNTISVDDIILKDTWTDLAIALDFENKKAEVTIGENETHLVPINLNAATPFAFAGFATHSYLNGSTTYPTYLYLDDIEIKRLGSAPIVINPIPSKNILLEGDDFSIDLNEVFYEPSGDSLEYRADFGIINENLYHFTADTPGIYNEKITATNSSGESCFVTFTISVISSANIIYRENFENKEVGVLPNGYTAPTITNPSPENVFAVSDDIHNRAGAPNKSFKHYIKNEGNTTAQVTADIGQVCTEGLIEFNAKVYTTGDAYSKAIYLLNNATNSAENYILSLAFSNASGGSAVTIHTFNNFSGTISTPTNNIIANDTWTDIKIILDIANKNARISIGDYEPHYIQFNLKPNTPLALGGFLTHSYYRSALTYASYLYLDDILIQYAQENNDLSINQEIEEQTVEINNQISVDIRNVFKDAQNSKISITTDKGTITNGILEYTPTVLGKETIVLTAINNNGGLLTYSISLNVIGKTAPTVKKQIKDQYITLGNAVHVSLADIFYDMDGDPLTISADKGEIISGHFHYTPTSKGTETIRIKAVDPDGFEALDTFNIIVNDNYDLSPIIYKEDFETTIENTIPSGWTTSLPATMVKGEGGAKVVIDGTGNKAFRLNHQTTGSGSMSAQIPLPNPFLGSYQLSYDMIPGGSTISREVVISNRNGELLYTFGISSDLTYFMIRSATETKQFPSRTYVSGQKYNVKILFDHSTSEVAAFVDNVFLGSLNLGSSGISKKDMDIAFITPSSYYRKGASTGHYIMIDNILLTGNRIVNQNDIDAIEQDKEDLTWERISKESNTNVTENLRLMNKGKSGSTITWKSSIESVLASNGMVLRPKNEDQIIFLTALIQKGSVTTQKTFQVVVKQAPSGEKTEVLFMDFEHDTIGEEIPGWNYGALNAHRETKVIAEKKNESTVLKCNNAHKEEQTYPAFNPKYELPEIYTGDIEISFDMMAEDTLNESSMYVHNSSGMNLFQIGSVNNMFLITSNATQNYVSNISVNPMEWYHHKVIVNTESKMAAWYINGEFAAAINITENISNNYGIQAISLYNRIRPIGVHVMYVDNISIKVDQAYELRKTLENLKFDTTIVDKNFKLPLSDENGTTFSWSSNNLNVIQIENDNAIINRDPNLDKTVLLTVTGNLKGTMATKDFEFVVKKAYTDSESVDVDLNHLTFSLLSNEPMDAITKNLKLPLWGEQGSSISWTSNLPSSLSIDQNIGRVVRNQENKDITVTAYVNKGAITKTKEFKITVLKDWGINIALNTAVLRTSSATIKDPISNAFDENFLSNWRTLKGDEKPYVVIDLGVKQFVDRAVISDFENVATFELFTSNDSLNFTKVLTHQNLAVLPGQNDHKTQINEFDFSVQECRYIKIEFSPKVKDSISVREIQLFNSKLTTVQALEYAKSNLKLSQQDRIEETIHLPLFGTHGTTIEWVSSNPLIISNEGIVQRQPTNTDVTLKAIIKKDGMTVEKDFLTTVIASGVTLPKDLEVFDPFVEDVAGLSDKEFFGVFDSAKKIWDIDYEPKINYEYDEKLKVVEDYVKLGDYESAKSELAYYFRERSIGSPYKSASNSYELAEVYANNIFNNSATPYVTTFTVPEKFGRVDVDVSSYIRRRGSYTLYMVQKYKHESQAEFYSKEAEGGIYAPTLTIVVNGQTKIYKAAKDTYVSPDVNKQNNYGLEERLYAKETKAASPSDVAGGYGNLWSKDTKRPYIQFNVVGLDEDDVITSAKMTLYGKTDGGKSDMTVWGEGNTVWKENSYNWDESLTTVFSWNGMEPDWKMPRNVLEGANTATSMNIARVVWLGTLVGCYANSKDEYYAYHSIRHVLNMIKNTTGYVDFYNLQDAGVRAGTMTVAFDTLRKSKYMSDAAMISIVKYMWQLNKSLTYAYNFRAGHNHGVFSNRGQMRITTMFPEFYDYKDNTNIFMDRWNILIRGLVGPDGSYKEASSGYTDLSIGILLNAAQDVRRYGLELDEFYNQRLASLAEYLANLLQPDGSDPLYGDSGLSNKISTIQNVAEYMDSDVLRYLSSNGREGTHPGYTSKYFPGANRYLVLRDDFTKDAFMLGTNLAYGDGLGHTHPDNLAITLYAYNKLLLTDNGHYTYNDDPISNWLKTSTESHNVVNINNIRQGNFADDLNDFYTNDGFDYYRATTRSTVDTTGNYPYSRSVMFSKSKFFIVSDKIEPPNGNKNRYDQNWHFLPDSNWTYDPKNAMLETRFAEGGNLIISQVDKTGFEMLKRDGYYSPNTNIVYETKYPTFRQEKTGVARFDTVLYPKQAGSSEKVETSRIPLDVSNDIATAFHIDVINGLAKQNNTYYQTYEAQPIQRTIGEYTFNGQAMLVEYQSNNALEAISLVKGNKLSKEINGEEKVLVQYEGGVPNDLFINYDGDEINILSGSLDINSISGLTIYTENDINTVNFNKEEIAFTKNGNYIKIDLKSESGSNKIAVSPIEKEQKTYMVGTLNDQYQNSIKYKYNGEHKATLMISESTEITGNFQWDGALPNLMLSVKSPYKTEGDVKAFFSFTNKDFTTDKTFALKIEKPSDLEMNVYVKGSLMQRLVVINKDDVQGTNQVLKSNEIGIFKGTNYDVLYSKMPFEVTLYKKYASPPPNSGGPIPGGGGGSPEGSVIPTPPPTSPPGTEVPGTPEPTPNGNSGDFIDIKGHWAEKEIIEMQAIGFVSGISNNEFAPNANITRAQFATIISRVLGLNVGTYENQFKDIKGDEWYAGPISAIHALNIMLGYDGIFRPNDYITRQEIAKVIVESYERAGKGIEYDDSILSPYLDKTNIAPWAQTYLAKAVELGFVKGKTETLIAPSDNATRAEAVVMIKRTYEKLKQL